MKRTLNLKFAALLAILAVAAAGGAHLLHGAQAARSAEGLRKQAERARREGDLEQAARSLQRYLSYRPGDTESLQTYGLLQADRANNPADHLRAMLTLEQVLRRDPERDESRRAVVALAMRPEIARYSDARTHLKELLRRQTAAPTGEKSTSEQGVLEYQLGRCAEGERKYEEAANWYRAALTHAPDQIDHFVRLASLLRERLNQGAEADRVMDAREVKAGIIKANPRSSRAFLERARYRREHAIDGAEPDIARALELAPEDLDALLAAAEQAIGKADPQAARAFLARGLKNQARDQRLYQVMAQIELSAGKLDAAEAALKQGIKVLTETEGRVKLLWTLANVQLDRGEIDEAGATVGRLRAEGTKPELLRYIQARVSVAQKHWQEAARQLEDVHPLLVDLPDLAYQADLFLGGCHERLGAVDRANAAYRRAVTLDPVALPGRLGLAATLTAMDRIDEALAIYRTVAAQAPEVRTTIARLLVVQNLRRPTDRRDWREVDRALDDMASTAPESVELPVLRAESLAARGRDDEARAVMIAARDRLPKRPEIWTALAALDTNRGRTEAGLAELDEAERRLGDRVEIRLARAAHWASRGGPEAVPNLGRLADRLESLPAGDRPKLLRGLADAYRQAGDLAGARRLLDRVVPLEPENLGVRLAQLDLAIQTGNEDDLRTLQAQIRALDERIGDGTSWRYARARYLIWKATRSKPVDRRPLDEARPLLVELGSRRPSWSLVPLAEAEINDQLGDHEEALRGYRRAIELGDRQLEVIRRTVQLLNEHHRYSQAAEVLQKLQEQGLGTRDPQFSRLAAEVSLRANEPARALDLARKAVPADSADYRDHLWLGQILSAAGQTDEAERALRKAVALRGDAAEARVALVVGLARAGKIDQARAATDEAQRTLPKDQVTMALAQCYAADGRIEPARAQFRAAVAAHPEDITTLRNAASFDLATSRPEEAEPLLRTIIAQKIQAADDAAWARRVLAVILAGGGGRRAHEALELMGLVAEESATSTRASEPVENLRAKAQVLALQPGLASRRAAIGLLEQINARGAVTPDDRFLLAQLNEAVGDWPAARVQFQTLLATADANPQYLAHYAQGLLQRGDPEAAATWLARLERLEPDAPRTVGLKARLLTARGKAAEAVALLRDLARRQETQVGAIAALLDELKQAGPAEELYRAAARTHKPEATLALAGFLGRQGRPDEALKLCDEARGACPPEQVAEAIVAAVYASGHDPERTRRAARGLEQSVSQHPRSMALVFELANLRLLEGRYREAEALFRRANELDRGHAGPLNNLSWLLAMADGKGDEALTVVNRAIELSGPTPALLDTRAVAYLVAGRQDAAIRDLKDAIAAAPSAPLFFHLAWAHRQARDSRAAAAAIRKARDAGLRDSDLHPLEQPTYRKLLAELARS